MVSLSNHERSIVVKINDDQLTIKAIHQAQGEWS